MLAAGEVPAGMTPQALAQIVYELKLTERVLEQRARAAGHSLPGEELLERVERRLFTMPTDNAEQILAIQAHARSLVHDLDVVSTLAASPRGMALLRTVHSLATDIDGPGFEMWNDYERVASDPACSDEMWRDHWAGGPEYGLVNWGGNPAAVERPGVAEALSASFSMPTDGHDGCAPCGPRG